MMTTKDILKETLGSLNFPDAAWDELAEKIDNNSVAVTDNEIIEFSKQKFTLGDDELPHTVAEAFCIRHGAKWMREKLRGKSTLEKIQEIASDEPSPWLEEARERQMHLNMQYYHEYCEANGYVTPKDWIENHKHF